MAFGVNFHGTFHGTFHGIPSIFMAFRVSFSWHSVNFHGIPSRFHGISVSFSWQSGFHFMPSILTPKPPLWRGIHTTPYWGVIQRSQQGDFDSPKSPKSNPETVPNRVADRGAGDGSDEERKHHITPRPLSG